MNHQQTMEKVEGFARWVEATTPDIVPISRRSGLELSNERNYHNPHTPVHGRSRMSIGRGCKDDGGDGDCRHCGLDPSEHPWRERSDGSIVGRSGKVLIPADSRK